MKNRASLALIYLIFTGAFAWGFAAANFKLFPGVQVSGFVDEITEFLNGAEEERQTTALQKLISDRGWVPYRYLRDNPPAFSMLDAPYHYKENQNAGPFLYIASKGKLDGYLLIGGVFHEKGGSQFALMAIDMQGRVMRKWKLPAFMDPGMTIDNNGIIYSLSLPLKTESGIVVNDWCGTRQNDFLRGAHHTLELAPDGTLWTAKNADILQIDVRNPFATEPKVLKRISLYDVSKENSSLGILTQRFDTHALDEQAIAADIAPIGTHWYHFHHNDVQPFVDKRFPTKTGYALLVSVRNLNLVFVMDPSSHKVLWWSQGSLQRQHDVDYYKGYVYAYDNQDVGDWSQLIKLDFDQPPGKERTIVIDGKNLNWHEVYWGMHEIFEYKNQPYHLVVSSRSGRIFITDAKGQLVFELLNRYPGNKALYLMAAAWISTENFNRWEADCKKP